MKPEMRQNPMTHLDKQRSPLIFPFFLPDIGREFCTGYSDVYGKWNTGFYCPQYGSKTAVFCCGTAVFKYCCTNQEPVDPNSSSGGLLDGDDPDFDGGPHHGVSSAVFVR